MVNVRYVCLSDLHFGEDRSLFSNMESGGQVDYSRPSRFMTEFVDCLKTILPQKKRGEKRTLILNGDALELAFCEMNLGGALFRQFMSLLMYGKNPIFTDFIFIPGNHDHHLWELARENQYLKYLKRKHRKERVNYLAPQRKQQDLPRPWHTTEIFLELEKNPISASFLSEITEPFRNGRSITVAYPNLALLNRDKSKCVVFHHGHFTESVYWSISSLKKNLFDYPLPSDVWELEEENYALIDFLWSALGRSGEAGHGLETIYTKLLKPETLHAVTSKIGNMIADSSSNPLVDGFNYLNGIETILNNIIRDYWYSERSSLDCVISESGMECLSRYLDTPLRRHIANRMQKHDPKYWDLPEEEWPDPPTVIDMETTFIFGHTHKSWYDLLEPKHYEKPVRIYNTGGWVVDSLKTALTHGGSIALVGENLETDLLWVYNESYDHKDYPEQVKCIGSLDQPENSLSKQTNELISQNKSSWKKLSTEIARCVSIRRNHLLEQVNEPL